MTAEIYPMPPRHRRHPDASPTADAWWEQLPTWQADIHATPTRRPIADLYAQADADRDAGGLTALMDALRGDPR